jgi:N-acetylglutamate synthase-like GNAT family acetyltransferase
VFEALNTLNMSIEIREATVTDSSIIEELYKELVGNSGVKVDPARVEQIATDPNNFLFVMFANGELTGTCFLTLCLDPSFGFQPYAVLENVIVVSENRGSGFGKLLFQYVERFCLSKDCSKIMLLSSIVRKEAHGFFKVMGYEENKKCGFIKYRSDFTVE